MCFLLDKFTSDTLKGGAKKPELAKVLCENSGADVEWLTAVVNLNLSLVARLGGHSALRFPSLCPPFPLLSSPGLLCPHQHTDMDTHNRQQHNTRFSTVFQVLAQTHCLMNLACG